MLNNVSVTAFDRSANVTLTRGGDLLVCSGAGGGYRPAADADWYLFAGDESALPAIGSAIEALPAAARGIAYLETADAAPLADVEVPAGIEVRALHRDIPGSRPTLPGC